MIRSSLAFAAALLLSALVAGGAVAGESRSAAGTTRILTSPPRILASVAQGASSTASILVENQSRASISLLVRAADLAPDPDGDSFGELVDVGDAPRGSGEWLSIRSPTLVLGPGERRTVPVTIRVPEDADAGGHYGAVVVETAPASDDAEVQLRVRLVTHVHVLVPGAVSYDARFVDLTSRRVQGGRIELRTRFENTGNIQTDPADAHVVLRGPTGERRARVDIPATMPGGARNLEVRVEIPSPAGEFDGRFHAKLEDGSTVRSRVASTIAWRPWLPMALAGAAGLVVFAFLVLLIRRRIAFRRLVRAELDRFGDDQPERDPPSD